MYSTSETSLATYLILSGFTLAGITYRDIPNHRPQGIFIFNDSPELRNQILLFETSQATVNLASFEKLKSKLIDKVLAGEER